MACAPALSTLDNLVRPHRSLFTPSFSLGLLGTDAQQPQPPPVQIATHPCAPFNNWNMAPSTNGAGVLDMEGFHVTLDVQQFKQEEVVVKTTGKYLVIEAKHEEKLDENRQMKRQMTRKYELPDVADMEKIECNMSSDGSLVIKVPRKIPQAPPETEEKIIPISAPKLGGSDSENTESKEE